MSSWHGCALGLALVHAFIPIPGAQAQGTDAVAPGPATTSTPIAPETYEAVATATRVPRPLLRIPATTLVLQRAEIEQTPSQSTDSLLRGLPSVATFRRSTSLTADPSSQGLNLRGVGPSGVSRTLVLVDGVPANDPFSGSIYWRALPRIGLERIEVVPSGGSALYGSAALAGVVQLFSRPLRESIVAEAAYGSRHAVVLAARGAYAWPRAASSLEAEYVRSDGYRVVAADQAGPIDRPAGSDHVSVNARGQVKASRSLSLDTAVRLFRQQQNGGTRYTSSAVSLAQLSLGGTLLLSGGADLSLRVFGRLQRFEQDRARVAMLRQSEARSARQDVPAQDQGASLVYRSRELTLGGRHLLSAGLDARRVAGESRERLFPLMPAADALRTRTTGGEQLLSGVFAEDAYTVSEGVELSAALRGDLFVNRDGSSELGFEGGGTERTSSAARTRYAISPRLGALVRPLPGVALRASVYRAFRAPTLNELYRPFQVGTVLTAANEALGPELLHGLEGGVELTPLDGLVLRATGFYNRLDRPISNVTQATPRPDGATRMRENLGHAIVRGVETALEHRLAPWLTTLVAYTLAASEVRDGGSVEELRGKRLPQDPVHRGSLLVLFDWPRWFRASAQLRVHGAQFEDDLNTLEMARFAVVDVAASRRLYGNLELFAAVENVLNTTYLVGRAGVDTVGPPFLARAGLRLREPSSD